MSTGEDSPLVTTDPLTQPFRPLHPCPRINGSANISPHRLLPHSHHIGCQGELVNPLRNRNGSSPFPWGYPCRPSYLTSTPALPQERLYFYCCRYDT
ncbi:hypothetical protein ACLOJK_034815 [Asimina triloba]